MTHVPSLPQPAARDSASSVANSRTSVLNLLSMLRRDRASILDTHGSPLEFCLAIIDPGQLGAHVVAAREQIDRLDADMRDYAVSSAYALLIGDDRRKALAAYFTPPVLASATLDAIGQFLEAGQEPAILDPACGGGSFLVPTARRLVDMHIAAGHDIEEACGMALEQLSGIEVDPGLATLSGQLLARMIRRDYGVERDATDLVLCADTLATTLEQRFDLIIGNPPYGKLFRSGVEQLTEAAGNADLGGHTNLYALFLIKALDWLNPGGGLAFVLPTSFVAGPYFSGLRQEIRKRARVVELAMHQQREDLFIDATQDVCLLVLQRFGPGIADDHRYRLGWIDAAGQRTILGTAAAPTDGEPWHLPVALTGTEEAHHHQLIAVNAASTFETYGYRIRVGKVVPTREGAFLHDEPADGRIPLLWASDIRANGSFRFQGGTRAANAAWYTPANPEKAPYVCRRRAVLVQRTSNRDQSRRLNAAPITKSFVSRHKRDGYVAENHVIVLEPTSDTPAVSQEVLARLLNSEVVNTRFSAVSGSFSVSAKLLARLALPSPDRLPEPGASFEADLSALFAPIDGVLVAPSASAKSKQSA
ncbi:MULTISPECIES: HsdM family class I SAM-dependent methyltransferase [Alphaproteobacteria]|uniref:HsdM family class I SAM-dependent methyltransferase n=2 Tax=Sphingopyxis sp. TaxID=1908224 RepID=UPI0040341116